PGASEAWRREADRLGIGRTRDARVQERPSARRRETRTPAAHGAQAARAALTVGSQQGTEAGRAVAGHEPAGDERPQGLLRGGGQETRRAGDVGEERGATALEVLEHGMRVRREVPGRLFGPSAEAPREILAQHEGERRGPPRRARRADRDTWARVPPPGKAGAGPS